MINMLIAAWLGAAAAAPDNFCIDLEESSFIFEQVDLVCEHSTLLQTIQQLILWMPTHHLFADAILAAATKSMGSRFAQHVTSYLHNLEASLLLPFPFGPVDDIFSLAFWPHLRPPSIKSWLDYHLFNTFCNIDPATMPREIANLLSTDVVVSPSCHPIPFSIKTQPHLSTPPPCP